MRRASRVDNTQSQIVLALRQAGAFVWDCSRLGNGFPDLLVAHRGTLYLLECKSPGGRLTPREQEFIQRCPVPVHIVYSPEDALRAVGILEEG